MDLSLQFYLFGSFEVWRGAERLSAGTWRTHKHAALLKILVGERGRVVPAERRTEWLWPDIAPCSGQANLYVGISLLRRALEPDLDTPAPSTYIIRRRLGYLFDPAAGCSIDVDQFETRLARAEAHERHGKPALAIHAYEAAAQLYRGDYLADDPHEDWAIGHRVRLREEYWRPWAGCITCACPLAKPLLPCAAHRAGAQDRSLPRGGGPPGNACSVRPWSPDRGSAPIRALSAREIRQAKEV